MVIRNLNFGPMHLVRWALAVVAAALLGTIMALVYVGVFIWKSISHRRSHPG